MTRRTLPAFGLLALLAASGCGGSPTGPDALARRCEHPVPLESPSTCATPDAPIDEFIVQLREGMDHRAEAARLGAKYGFEPELWSITPAAFGARLSRASFYGMQCEPTVKALSCSNTNIPPP